MSSLAPITKYNSLGLGLSALLGGAQGGDHTLVRFACEPPSSALDLARVHHIIRVGAGRALTNDPMASAGRPGVRAPESDAAGSDRRSRFPPAPDASGRHGPVGESASRATVSTVARSTICFCTSRNSVDALLTRRTAEDGPELGGVQRQQTRSVRGRRRAAATGCGPSPTG